MSEKTRSRTYGEGGLGGISQGVKVIPVPAFEGFDTVTCPNDLSSHLVEITKRFFKCPIDDVLLVWD